MARITSVPDPELADSEPSTGPSTAGVAMPTGRPACLVDSMVCPSVLGDGLLVKVDSRHDLHGNDESNDPVDNQTEGGPPASLGNVSAPVLPQILGPVARIAQHEKPGRSRD